MLMKRKNYPGLAYGLILSVAVFSSSFLTSCIDNDYDLSQDIDMTIKAGGDSISFPIGSTDCIYLKKILKVEDSPMLNLADKEYYLQKDGEAQNINVTVPKVKATSLASVSFDKVIQTVVPAGEYTIPIDNFQSDGNLTLSVNCANSTVVSLKKVYLENASATIKITLKDNNNKLTLKRISNLVVTFPDFVVSPDLSNQKLSIAEATAVNGIITKSISITAIDLGTFQKPDNNVLTFGNQPIYVSGKAVVSCSSIVSGSIHFNMQLTPSTMTAAKAVGVFDPDIHVTVNPVMLNDLPDWLNDKTVRLDIANPEIKVRISNSVAMRVVATDSKIIGSSTATIPYLYVESAGNKSEMSTLNKISTTGNFDFDPTANEFKADYTHSQAVNNLGEVITTIPKQISFVLDNVHSDTSVPDSIVFGKAYSLGLKYQVLIPFKFGGKLAISYNDTINDLHKNLKDINATKAVVRGTVYNTIPLKMKVTATPFDASGNDLSKQLQVVISNEIAAGGGNDKSVASTPLTVSVTEASGSDGVIKNKLERIILSVTAASQDSGGTLYSDQYILMKDIKAVIYGGVIIDAND